MLTRTWCLNRRYNADSNTQGYLSDARSGLDAGDLLGVVKQYYWEYSLSGIVITVIDKAPIPLDVPRAMVPNSAITRNISGRLKKTLSGHLRK